MARKPSKADVAYAQAMGRPIDAEKPVAPPPSYLGQAADDPRTLWVMEVHADAGRRVFFGSLAVVEGSLDAFGGQPNTTMWLFPAVTHWERHKYKQLAKRGWMRAGWHRGAVDAQVDSGEWAQWRLDMEDQVEEWRRIASGAAS
ncbi:MAG: hypothetical protein ACM3Q1_05950 [Bacteroidales bacterium]